MPEARVFEVQISRISQNHAPQFQEENKMYIRNFDPEWTYTIGKDGGINSYHNTTYDGHGGHAVEHRAEMVEIAAEIAEKKIQEAIPQITEEAYTRALNDLLEASRVDVESVVNVGFKNGAEIFHDKKTQKVIVDSVMNEVKKQLGKGKYKIRM